MPVCGKTDGSTVKVTGTCAYKAWDMAFLPLSVSLNTLMNLLWTYQGHKENYSDWQMAVLLLVLILLWLMESSLDCH